MERNTVASGEAARDPVCGMMVDAGKTAHHATHEGSTYHFCSRSEEHTSELQSLRHLVCRLLLEKKKKNESIAVSKACCMPSCSAKMTRSVPVSGIALLRWLVGCGSAEYCPDQCVQHTLDAMMRA